MNRFFIFLLTLLLAGVCPGKSRHFLHWGLEEGLTNSQVADIALDRHGNVWIATQAGLNLFDGKRFKLYDITNSSIAGNSMTTLLYDKDDDHLWIGTYGSGIYVFDRSARMIDHISIDNGFCSNVIHQLYADQEGGIWVATLHGLGHFGDSGDRKTFVNYTHKNGLSDIFVHAVCQDDGGNMWFSTNSGISMLDVANGSFRHYDYSIVLYVLLVGGLILVWILNYKHRLLKSSREKLEREKVRAEQERNNERLRFYTNVTHELRTPLTLILGPLEDMTKDPNLPQPYDHKIRIIKESAVKLLDLINQLLEFRKTETQNKRLAVSRQDITITVREMALRYKELNRNPNLFFSLHIPAESIPVYYDKEVVDTILTNLLSNAIKYTQSGSITIGLKRVEAEKNYIELFVSDTGYGIEEKDLPHIFDRYYQANGSHQASGTGIGLALVKSLAELHEGTLSVQSKVGIGTVFSFRLLQDNTYPNALHKEQPAAQEESKEEEAEPEVTAAPDTKPLILIVEDNDDIRDYTSDALSDEYNVITAVNGKEGVDKAMAQIPDVIVSDIMMPVMDGIDVCRILKANVATSHIPIILLTAKTSITDKEVGYESGADSYLTKHFSATLLKNRIKNILDNRTILYKFIKSLLLVNGGVAETDTADENSTEVAYASGFNGVSYFANRFKKEYGVLPSQYTKKQ